MARRPKPIDPTGSATSLFGSRTRELRLDRGWGPDDLGDAIGCSGDHISRIELGKRAPDDKIAAGLDRVFSTGQYFQDLQPLVLRERIPEPARALADQESQAVRLLVYEPNLITGLLQTEEYMRALTSATLGAERIEEVISERLRRQRILARESPPWLTVLMDEAALRRPIGGSEVLGPQLDTLAESAQRRTITVQAVPRSQSANAGLGGTCILMNFAEGGPSAYIEGFASIGQVLNDPSTLNMIEETFDLIRAAALTAEQTQQLIQEIRESL